jgi:PhzF family phenazine biosynthesis protein
MASPRAFRILNVFTVGDDRFSGNPLCVFEDGRGLDDRTMQAIARQFNLSETTFLLPPEAPGATAKVRIFTPALEMPFAGHPTLGSAHVARDLLGTGDRVTLQMKAGLVDVNASADRFTLRTARAPEARPHDAPRAELAKMLGLVESSLAGPVMWVNTGAEQLVVPVANVEDVQGARPIAEMLTRLAMNSSQTEAMAYVWAPAAEDTIVSRFFFVAAGSVLEDPATGSACANLGGWMITTGARLPVHARVEQGAATGRPSLLELTVDLQKQVFVGGGVIELGRGSVNV